MEEKYMTKLLTFSNDIIGRGEELIINKEQAKGIIKELEQDYIPKKVIEIYLKEEQERFDVCKKESKKNENLKLGMWRHLGAKNMCKKILGIEKNIATLD